MFMYTSGSTGKPKRHAGYHYNVCRLMQATQHWLPVSTKRIVWDIFFIRMRFDFSVWEPLGCAAVPVAAWSWCRIFTSRSSEDFYALLAKRAGHGVNQTPSAFRQLMQAEETLGASTESLAPLRYIRRRSAGNEQSETVV